VTRLACLVAVVLASGCGAPGDDGGAAPGESFIAFARDLQLDNDPVARLNRGPVVYTGPNVMWQRGKIWLTIAPYVRVDHPSRPSAAAISTAAS
jgi:hypothetical protein